MPQALRQHLDDPSLGQEQVIEQPKFQAYVEQEHPQLIQFKELLFFAQLSAFCVITVAIAFFLLSAQLGAILAIPLALVIGFGLVFLLKSILLRILS